MNKFFQFLRTSLNWGSTADNIHFTENSFNPLSPNIHIQILQTDRYTFPSWMGWEKLIKNESIVS